MLGRGGEAERVVPAPCNGGSAHYRLIVPTLDRDRDRDRDASAYLSGLDDALGFDDVVEGEASFTTFGYTDPDMPDDGRSQEDRSGPPPGRPQDAEEDRRPHLLSGGQEGGRPGATGVAKRSNIPTRQHQA